MMDDSYSPDVEIDENGNVVCLRDVDVGDVLQIPTHMFAKMGRNMLSALQRQDRLVEQSQWDEYFAKLTGGAASSSCE